MDYVDNRVAKGIHGIRKADHLLIGVQKPQGRCQRLKCRFASLRPTGYS